MEKFVLRKPVAWVHELAHDLVNLVRTQIGASQHRQHGEIQHCLDPGSGKKRKGKFNDN